MAIMIHHACAIHSSLAQWAQQCRRLLPDYSPTSGCDDRR